LANRLDIPPIHLEDRLTLFPRSTKISGQPGLETLTIAGIDLQDLAAQYATPLYLYDRATMDAAVGEYRQALAQAYPGEAGITYASKSYLCLAIAQWSAEMDLWLDVTGIGEMTVARAAAVPKPKILVHGVNKSQVDLEAAIAMAGVIVIDNLAELNRLLQILSSSAKPYADIWLRFRPGLAVQTHTYTQTGQIDSKFGMGLEEIEQAVRLCVENNLPLKGIHFHQGSHFHDPAPLKPALESTLDLVSRLHNRYDWTPQVLCPGGGWGVPYHEDDLPHLPVINYIRTISSQLVDGCSNRQLPLPRLQIEPGRSLVAQAGVAIYRVDTVKHTPGRRWLLLNGGMADNPRPALYRARYSALPVANPQRPSSGFAWLAGPYCESGDILIEDLAMPEVEPGELIAIPVSGAYQLSMGSNYNGAPRPAVVWLSDGRADLIQRRETFEELIRRDLPLPAQQDNPK